LIFSHPADRIVCLNLSEIETGSFRVPRLLVYATGEIPLFVPLEMLTRNAPRLGDEVPFDNSFCRVVYDDDYILGAAIAATYTFHFISRLRILTVPQKGHLKRG